MFLEVVFLSVIVTPVLPHRRADVEAFWRYYKAPTSENWELWLQERQKTENQVALEKLTATVLAIGNLFLIVRVARRKPVRKSEESTASRSSGERTT